VAPVALDIAMTLIGCCFDRTTYSIKCRLAVAFLDAYDSVRHIPDAEWGALQAFVKYAIIATAFWRFRYA
jgi:Ser/Thr protein kinase RdoA (MazF antagonist)